MRPVSWQQITTLVYPTFFCAEGGKKYGKKLLESVLKTLKVLDSKCQKLKQR